MGTDPARRVLGLLAWDVRYEKSVPRTAAWLMAGVAMATFLVGVRASALPRYQARYEQECALCHVNPTGGGMRTSYATQDLVPREFALGHRPTRPPLTLPFAAGVSFGVDHRELYTTADPSSEGLDFFLMQTDVYAAFQPDSSVLLYVDRGMSGTFETFGMYYCLPWHGYLKAGRFIAPYGWKYDDHTHFVREYLGFTPTTMSDVGLEAGISPPSGNVQLAILNGNRGSTVGADRRLAASISGTYRLRAGPVAASLGGSGYREEAGRLSMGGAHSYLAVGYLAWVGEVDLVHEELATEESVERLVTTHELSFTPVQGLEILGTLDFLDPDVHRSSGSTDRWGGGIQLFLHPSMVLSGSYTTTRSSPPTGADSRNLVAQIHFLY